MSTRITTAMLRVLVILALFNVFAFSGRVAAQEESKPARLKTHRPAITGVHGLVTSGHSLASMAGVRVLLDGGNAADAAVAVLATLNLTEPMNSGAGGNGFMTIYDRASDRVYSLNATGAAPAAIDPNHVTPDEMLRGIKAGVVPGLFGGWIVMLDRFGTKSLADVLEPAIEYAENGHPLDPYVATSIARQRSLFERFPSTARVFLPNGGPPEPSEMFKYPDLASTFKRVVDAEKEAIQQGKSRSEALQAAFDRFYKGDIAQQMARFYQENGGLLTAEDLANYEPIWAEPVHTNYRGYDVYTSPSTSRGGLEVVMQLSLIEGYDLQQLGHNTAETLHLITECIKLAKSDIYHFVADPKFTNMPMDGMISEDYARARRKEIDLDRAMTYPDHGNPVAQETSKLGSQWKHAPPENRPLLPERAYGGCTSSFSVADHLGNVVVCTPTLGSGWGTGVIVGETGLFFNNGTRIGSTSPYPDDVNYVRGGQIALLNNSPIIVMRDGKFFLSLGTPGGETIGQTQFQVLLNVLDFGMGIQEAIETPRLSLSAKPNFYKPGAEIAMRVEGRVPSRVLGRLEEMGHRPRATAEFAIGNMQGILMNQNTGTMTAGADPRRMMYAIGW
ncbi:MAG: gamma-glutamyltransferase family protein [Planctomycetes bacterium]|nr:gamma-glutamyltransferase family protein [Planctomycetota bacterium]MBL7042119.1 gamma-glutamyltransferase family protein [Pirellulaceae bacterium]